MPCIVAKFNSIRATVGKFTSTDQVASCPRVASDAALEVQLGHTMTMIKNFLSNESGATAIEYGLIAALIAVVIIGAVTAVGTSLNTTFGSVAGAVK